MCLEKLRVRKGTETRKEKHSELVLDLESFGYFFFGGVVIFAFSVVGGWWWWPCGVQFQGYFCLVRCGCWYPRGEDHEDGIWLVFGVLCPVQSLSAVELFEPVGFLSVDSLSCLR